MLDCIHAWITISTLFLKYIPTYPFQIPGKHSRSKLVITMTTFSFLKCPLVAMATLPWLSHLKITLPLVVNCLSPGCVLYLLWYCASLVSYYALTFMFDPNIVSHCVKMVSFYFILILVPRPLSTFENIECLCSTSKRSVTRVLLEWYDYEHSELVMTFLILVKHFSQTSSSLVLCDMYVIRTGY